MVIATKTGPWLNMYNFQSSLMPECRRPMENAVITRPFPISVVPSGMWPGPAWDGEPSSMGKTFLTWFRAEPVSGPVRRSLVSQFTLLNGRIDFGKTSRPGTMRQDVPTLISRASLAGLVLTYPNTVESVPQPQVQNRASCSPGHL